MAEKGYYLTDAGSHVAIHVPKSEIQGFRVALSECPCGAAKSIATMEIRKRIVRALGAFLSKGKA